MEEQVVWFPEYEYSEWLTRSTLTEKYDITFTKSGWYRVNRNDWALIVERHGRLKLTLWIGIDPRDDFDKVLGLSEMT